MPKKRTVIILLIIMAVCIVIGGVNMIANRTAMRQPTQQEIDACVPYAIDWQTATGQEGSEKEIILSLCTFAEEKTIGENLYQTYTSDTLSSYLYDFQEMMEIAELNGMLYISYETPRGGMVTLAYDDEGMMEKMVYDLETDICYYETRDTFEVWTNFRNGYQMGF